MSPPLSTDRLRWTLSVGHHEQQLVCAYAELGTVLGLLNAGLTDVGPVGAPEVLQARAGAADRNQCMLARQLRIVENDVAAGPPNRHPRLVDRDHFAGLFPAQHHSAYLLLGESAPPESFEAKTVGTTSGSLKAMVIAGISMSCWHRGQRTWAPIILGRSSSSTEFPQCEHRAAMLPNLRDRVGNGFSVAGRVGQSTHVDRACDL